jgi:hypothetical protein
MLLCAWATRWELYKTITFGCFVLIFVFITFCWALPKRQRPWWCKNDISSRIFQTHITAFTLLLLVDVFTLHMLLGLHIIFILLVLYSLRPKLLECFDLNTNIKEFVRNL